MSGRCPICGRPVAERFRPFCSRRCADVDLGRWLAGVYRVPSQAGEEDGAADLPDEEADASQGPSRAAPRRLDGAKRIR